MAWDKGFDFRATAGYVTDPANCVSVPGSDPGNGGYPTTSNGVTYGWTANVIEAARDRNNAIDARLAGLNRSDAQTPPITFRVDLPSAGDYNITLALGDASGTVTINCTVYDNVTSLFTISGSTGGTERFFDATGVIRNSAALWVSNNVPLLKTFASTTFNLSMTTVTSPIAHLFISQVSAASSPPGRNLMLLGVG